jgi:hypothetical protein
LANDAKQYTKQPEDKTHQDSKQGEEFTFVEPSVARSSDIMAPKSFQETAFSQPNRTIWPVDAEAQEEVLLQQPQPEFATSSGSSEESNHLVTRNMSKKPERESSPSASAQTDCREFEQGLKRVKQNITKPLQDPELASSKRRQSNSPNYLSIGEREANPRHVKSTNRWLHDFFMSQDSYRGKLTKMPADSKIDVSQSSEQRRPSEPILPSTALAKGTRNLVPQSNVSDPGFDTQTFKSAVNDLETLLNEVLTLAAEVIDGSYPHSRPENGTSLTDLSSSSCSVTNESLGFQIAPDQNDDVKIGTQNTPAELYKSELDVNRADQGRPYYRHAATFSGHPERLRLSSVVEKLANSFQIGRSQMYDTGSRDNSDSSRIRKPLVIEVPERNSSRDKTRCVESVYMRGVSQPGVPEIMRRALDQISDVRKAYCTSSATEVVDFDSPFDAGKTTTRSVVGQHSQLRARGTRENLPARDIAGRAPHHEQAISLRGRSHVSLRDIQGFSLARSHKRQPIARDWSPNRKRFVAAVACISTAVVGIILGIYAGLVPSIQYYIIDTSRIAIHGNTGCFAGLALPIFFLWPLPLLHGRKPYILSSLVVAMPLLFLQAIAINSQRLTNTT